MNLKQFILNIKSHCFPDIVRSEYSGSTKSFFILSAITAIELVIIFLLFPVSFETYDDSRMNAIVSGAMTGEPSEMMIFINVIIGKILKTLYSIAPNINWYTLIILTTLYISYFAIQLSFHRLKTDVSIKIVRHIIIFSTLLFSLYVPGFTRVAAIAAMAGLSIILLSKTDERKYLIFGIGLLTISSLIRYNAFLMVLVISFPLLLGMIIKKKYIKILFLGIAVLLAFAAKRYDVYMYESNLEYAIFKIRNSKNNSITTYNKPDLTYDKVKGKLGEINWSKEDFDLVRQGLYDIDLLKFNMANLDYVGVSQKTLMQKLKDPSLVPKFKSAYTAFWYYIDGRYYYFFPVFILFLLLVGRRPYEFIFTLIYAAYILSLAFYLHFFQDGALKIRVLVGMTIPLILLISFYLDKKAKLPKQLCGINQLSNQNIRTLIISIAAAFFAVTFYDNKDRLAGYRYEYRDRNHKFLEYIAQQKHEFYVHRLVSNPFYIYNNPFDLSNAYLLGWSIGTPANQEKIKNYTADKSAGIYSIYNQDIIWYFDTYLNTYKEDPDIVEAFYKTNFKYCTVEKETIKIRNYKLHRHTYRIYPDSAAYFDAINK